MNGFKVKIYVKDGAVSKFCRSRKMAFALQEGVHRELKRLEDDGIIKSLAYADWANPIVVVPKADGQLRIFGDFKATINPYINTEQYPLPTADDLFQKNAGR